MAVKYLNNTHCFSTFRQLNLFSTTLGLLLHVDPSRVLKEASSRNGSTSKGSLLLIGMSMSIKLIKVSHFMPNACYGLKMNKMTKR